MKEPRNIVVIQTAFIGDAILTLPLIQAARKAFPKAKIDVVVIPRSMVLFANHPDIRETIAFDKRRLDRGIRGLLRVAKRLRSRSYDVALIPHQSIRSAVLARLARVPVRIGFDRSAGRLLLTGIVPYRKELS